MRLRVWCLALLSGLRIQCCSEQVAGTVWIPRCCGSGVGWQLQPRFNPKPGNPQMPGERPKKWQKKRQKNKTKQNLFLTLAMSVLFIPLLNNNLNISNGNSLIPYPLFFLALLLSIFALFTLFLITLKKFPPGWKESFDSPFGLFPFAC